MPKPLLLALLALLCLHANSSAATVLSEGSAPPALNTPWFPDRMHAFIWRNWNVVELDRLAQVLGTSPENVKAVAAAMGLPPSQALGEQWMARSYLTVIRRNWQLLPYDQLVELLGWTPERLAFTLREDDFLFIKLGSLKPRCERLKYEAPNDAAVRREREIRQIVEREFGDEMKKPAQPRFAFLDEFQTPVPGTPPPVRAPAGGLRFSYSYCAVYGDSLLDSSLDPYPDGLLKQLAERGVNGVWLHCVLRDLAVSKDFPEFGAGSQQRLKTLRDLVKRADRFGIGVYLYMNEPRAMPAAFFKNRPEMAGVREGDYIAMCTSNPTVRQWLGDSLEQVFKSVPHLAGVFTITASENLTSCASHQHMADCPRCSKRTGAEIIAEVNSAIEAGVHRGNPDAKVIVWDWGWPDAWTPEIISHLPKSCWLMSVSEWGMPIERGGVKSTVGEYSISAIGPGPRATRNWALARQAGLKTVAKVQLNNSWELSAVPYLPVMDLVAEHCRNLASAQTDGEMLSWSLGGYPSPNLELAQRLLTPGAPAMDRALDDIAAERYGPPAAGQARRAWTDFSAAFRQYPFDATVVYNCPVQLGPANLLYLAPTDYHATMVGFPYDDLNTWRGPYPADVFTSQFQKLADQWDTGVSELKQTVNLTTGPARQRGDGDLRLAQAAALHFRSVANQARFVIARDQWARSKLPADRQRLRDEMRSILASEATAAKQLFALTRADSRIGFEASNQYYYLPQDLMEKVIDCRYLIEQTRR